VLAVRRLGVAAAAIAAVLVGCGLAVAQVRELTLPGVTVTAPPFAPLYLRRAPDDMLNSKAYQRNPYFGNNRVEEDHFTPVPCTGFRIDPAAAGTSDRTCLQGYRMVPGYLHATDRNWKNNCQMDHDVSIYNVGDLSVEADVFVFDPYKLTALGYAPNSCYVAGYNSYDRDDFPDMNRITRNGSNWHDFRGKTCAWSDRSTACEAKSIEFSYGPDQCVALRRLGPRWGEGYVWMLTASICRTGGAGLGPDDVERALAPLQIRQYDPNGTIARPPK
jgi:hypothetical protein